MKIPVSGEGCGGGKWRKLGYLFSPLLEIRDIPFCYLSLMMCVYAFLKVTVSYNLDFYLPHNSKRIKKKNSLKGVIF